MDLSIIIVNYRTKELTKDAIRSVHDTIKELNYEVIVVDNHSEDGSYEYLEKAFINYDNVHIVKNKKNDGFAKANNLGIRKSVGDYILLLNSDTIVQKDCIDKCVAYIKEESNIGALGCKILLPNGNLDHACKRGFPTPFNSMCYFLKLHKLFPGNPKYSGYLLNHLDQNKIHDVDSLMGAFMLLPRHVINQVGLLSEDYFMYGEDIDWCYTIKQAGYKIVYYPHGKILHIKGQSSKKRKFKTLFEFDRAMILFYNKHYRGQYNMLVTLLTYIGISVHFIMRLIVNFFRKEN